MGPLKAARTKRRGGEGEAEVTKQRGWLLPQQMKVRTNSELSLGLHTRKGAAGRGRSTERHMLAVAGTPGGPEPADREPAGQPRRK